MFKTHLWCGVHGIVRVMRADSCTHDSFAKSLVNGTNDDEACTKRWAAALVQMNCEKKVAEKLDKMGIANYVPIQREENKPVVAIRIDGGLA